MDITPALASNALVIQSYGPGYFRINGKVHHGALSLFDNAVTPWPAGHDAHNLNAQDFKRFTAFENSIDVFLIGGGAPPVKLALIRQTIHQAGLRSADIMDTGAACRTYNSLIADGRRVGAALLAL
jgi:uncharacterized protein